MSSGWPGGLAMITTYISFLSTLPAEAYFCRTKSQESELKKVGNVKKTKHWPSTLEILVLTQDYIWARKRRIKKKWNSGPLRRTHPPTKYFFLFWTCPFISAMFVSFCRAMFSDLKWIRIWYQMYQIFDRTCQKNFKIDSQTCSCLFLIRTFFPAQVYFLWRRVRQTFALRK